MDPATRVISHMNKDHQDSVIRFLEHYHGVSSWAARNSIITNMTLHSISITTRPGARQYKANGPDLAHTYVIPLSPPLQSWSEARERAVVMDKECVAALGRECITLKKYLPPSRPLHIAIFVTCLLTYLTLFRRANLAVETAPRIIKPLLERFPTAAAFLWRVQPYVFWPTLLIHIVEVIALDQRKLSRFSVPRGSSLWWKYILGTFIDGFPNFVRIDQWAAEEQKAKAAKQH